MKNARSGKGRGRNVPLRGSHTRRLNRIQSWECLRN